jgi:hypothetical protein
LESYLKQVLCHDNFASAWAVGIVVFGSLAHYLYYKTQLPAKGYFQYLYLAVEYAVKKEEITCQQTA